MKLYEILKKFTLSKVNYFVGFEDGKIVFCNPKIDEFMTYAEHEVIDYGLCEGNEFFEKFYKIDDGSDEDSIFLWVTLKNV